MQAETGPVPRAETGPVQFGDDWPGMFIRGKHAFFYLKVCEALSASNTIAAKGLEQLKELLGECIQGSNIPVKKLKEFKECVED